MPSSSQFLYSAGIQVQHSRANDSSFEMMIGTGICLGQLSIHSSLEGQYSQQTLRVQIFRVVQQTSFQFFFEVSDKPLLKNGKNHQTFKTTSGK